MNRKGRKRSSNSNSSEEEADSKREIQSLREMGSSSNSKMEKAIVGLSGEGENATLSLSLPLFVEKARENKLRKANSMKSSKSSCD